MSARPGHICGVCAKCHKPIKLLNPDALCISFSELIVERRIDGYGTRIFRNKSFCNTWCLNTFILDTLAEVSTQMTFQPPLPFQPPQLHVEHDYRSALQSPPPPRVEIIVNIVDNGAH